jgi:hypothetical protein
LIGSSSSNNSFSKFLAYWNVGTADIINPQLTDIINILQVAMGQKKPEKKKQGKKKVEKKGKKKSKAVEEDAMDEGE